MPAPPTITVSQPLTLAWSLKSTQTNVSALVVNIIDHSDGEAALREGKVDLNVFGKTSGELTLTPTIVGQFKLEVVEVEEHIHTMFRNENNDPTETLLVTNAVSRTSIQPITVIASPKAISTASSTQVAVPGLSIVPVSSASKMKSRTPAILGGVLGGLAAITISFVAAGFEAEYVSVCFWVSFRFDFTVATFPPTISRFDYLLTYIQHIQHPSAGTMAEKVRRKDFQRRRCEHQLAEDAINQDQQQPEPQPSQRDMTAVGESQTLEVRPGPTIDTSPEIRAQLDLVTKRVARLEAEQAPSDYVSSRS
ncbi:hypothetical protein V5O48_016884 [Marasmius crinis-equi]|uniref:Uncharacterized protein n=1 Tax=Marasmius crinis-equi TaxID=585013 RepID=A0ABR3EQL0_9AGAR